MLAKLREVRLQAGLTQAQVARALGRPQSFVAKCELGERRIDPIDLQDFAQIYGRPLTFFLPSHAKSGHSTNRSSERVTHSER